MQRIEVNGLVYEFEDDMSLMSLLDENADRVYEGIATEEAPPNDPLTLEELREMDGEPVWICDPDGSDGMWALVDLEYELCRTAKGGIAIFDTYGKTWLAYRRKPEGNV